MNVKFGEKYYSHKCDVRISDLDLGLNKTQIGFVCYCYGGGDHYHITFDTSLIKLPVEEAASKIWDIHLEDCRKEEESRNRYLEGEEQKKKIAELKEYTRLRALYESS